QRDEDAMAEYGMRLGTAFQLIDDVLDLSGESDEIGKNLGDDIAEGKPTMPLLIAMRKGTEAEKQVIRHAIEQGGLDNLDAVLDAVANTEALDQVRMMAANEAEKGCAAIAHLPDSDFKQALLELAKFSVERNH
ncbi:MAG: polyprenyl synthetase family protein, partial [Methylophilaceae bacterium]|nr:polyprenyl synthetase family protein [Methylophilaceae bacterium]